MARGWWVLLALLASPSRADLNAPSPSPAVAAPCADPLTFDCYPLIDRGGVVAVPHPQLAPTNDFTMHEVELISVAHASELLRGDAIVPRIRSGGFRKLPPPILASAYGTGARMKRLRVDAEGWTFRVEGGTLIAERQGKTRWRLKIHPGGFECYEGTPWVVNLWLDPAQKVLVLAAWGDKCAYGSPSWEVLRL